MTVNTRNRRCYRVRTRRRTAGNAGERVYMCLTLAAAAGALTGTFAHTDAIGMLVSERTESFTAAFSGSLCRMTVYILICFLAGFSAAGKPVGYMLCFFKGLGAGALTACIFGGGTAAADIAAAADILPAEALGIAILIYAARENIRMSGITQRRTFGMPAGRRERTLPENGEADLRLYLKKFFCLELYAAAAAVIDGIITIIIMK